MEVSKHKKAPKIVVILFYVVGLLFFLAVASGNESAIGVTTVIITMISVAACFKHR